MGVPRNWLISDVYAEVSKQAHDTYVANKRHLDEEVSRKSGRRLFYLQLREDSAKARGVCSICFGLEQHRNPGSIHISMSIANVAVERLSASLMRDPGPLIHSAARTTSPDARMRASRYRSAVPI